MLALHALLELRVDIERHLGVGVPDLAHDPLDVEAIGQQRDGSDAIGLGHVGSS
jgi:hypothetical protein